MTNNYYTLKILCEYLDEKFRGSEIHEIFTQEKSKLVMVLEKNSELYHLEYSAEKDLPYFVYREKFSRAKKNVVSLLNECTGKKINKFTLKNNDRILSIKLNNEELIFSFIPSLLNSFLLENNIVKNTYKDKERFAGKKLEELFPVKNIPEGEPETVSDLLKTRFSNYGKEIHNEVLTRLKIRREDMLENDLKMKIDDEFSVINRRLQDPEYILYENDEEVFLSILELRTFDNYRKEYFNDINSLILAYINRKAGKEKIESIKEAKIKEKNKEIGRIIKQIEGLEKQIENCENADELKMKGDLIYSNFHLLKKGDTELKTRDEYGKESIVKLKRELSPSENADRYYEKYKKQKGSVDILKNKLRKLTVENQRLQEELQLIEKTEDRKTILKMEKQLNTGRGKEQKIDETTKFRKFVLNNKYEVWTGKDSASNDLLTTKYTAQNDLWFHVRGASGSHTVLKVHNKKEDIDKKIIETAASIAAYYSKARNASNVPVAYCEKKFVKKKKGMKSGSVIMEREKVIFVKPGLPEEL